MWRRKTAFKIMRKTRVGAEERLKNPARCLSGHELREQ